MPDPIIKYAEAQFTTDEIHSAERALGDPVVHARFLKFAENLKRVAPRAKDFLYFSAVMMHSAEAALIDQKTGEPKLDAGGKPLTAEWKVDDRGSWKWACSDSGLKPYKNNNGDIFPESELKKAYRQWIGRPLCKDHQSSTVDGVRGLVIDTYWDDRRKRVIALCALDKVNYPDLARKVETGYANNVSMGTAVGKSICFECGNVATTEAEYCDCVKGKNAYGEINIDLSPIELSLVVTGADPGAKLRSIVASLNDYSQEKQARIKELRAAGCVTPGELERLEQEVISLKGQLAAVGRMKTALDGESSNKIRNLMEVLKNPDVDPETKRLANEHLRRELAEDIPPTEMRPPAAAAQDSHNGDGPGNEHPESGHEGDADDVAVDRPYGLAGNLAMTGGRGGATQDPHSSGPPPWSFDGRESRLASCGGLEAQIQTVQGRLNAMEQTLCDLSRGLRAKAGCSTRHKEDKNMSEAMKERARARRAMFQKEAYHQGGGGVNDPQTYPVDPGEAQARKQDKQMVGEGMEPGSDGLAGNDLEVKKKLSRAELEERRLRREALLSSSGETKVTTVKTPDGQDVYLAKSDTDPQWRPATKQEVDDHLNKVAYHQGGGGVNDPQTYPVDPGEAQARKQDKQMVGEGMEPGSDGLAGNDLEVKKRVLRASQLSAKFIKVFADAGKKDLLKGSSRWEIYADGDKVLEATAEQIFGDKLDQYWDHLSSEKYGHEVIRAIRKDGLTKVAYLLTGEMVSEAQDPAPPAPAPAMPPGGPEAMPLPESPEGEEKGPEATKGAVETALAKVEQAVGDLSDILQEEGVVSGGKEKLPPIEEGAKEADDKFRDRVLEVQSALDDSGDELALISETLEKRIEAGLADTAETAELMRIAQESLETSAELRSEAALIVEAKKGKLPPWLEKGKKKGEEEEEEKEEKGEKKEKKEEKKEKKEKKEEKKEEKDEKKEEKEEEGNGKEAEASALLDRLLKARAASRRELLRQAMEEPAPVEELAQDVKDLSFEEWAKQEMAEEEEHGAEEADAMDEGYVDDPMVAELLAELEGEEGVESVEPLFEEEEPGAEVEGEEEEAVVEEEPAEDQMVLDAAQRKAWRESVAAEVGAKYQQQLGPAVDVDTDMLQRAHPQGGHTLEGLDTNVSEGLDHVERIDEIKKKIMQQVQHLPPVREAVEHVAQLLKKGAMAPSDLGDAEKLKALAVDPEAAKYWKQYWGEGDQASSQFGTELVKEFVQKKAAQDAESYRLKLRRAYDVALEMQDKGLISEGRPYLEKMVDDIMKFDDKAFEAFKRAMERTERIAKVASQGGNKALEVGLKDEPAGGAPVTLAEQLGRLW